MMISPETYIESMKGKNYPELIKERDRLVRYVRGFEKKERAGDRSGADWGICPSPAVRYQVYLDYLSRLCTLMAERYNQDYVWGDRQLKDE